MRQDLHGPAVGQIQINQCQIRHPLRHAGLIFPQGSDRADFHRAIRLVKGPANGLDMGGFVFRDQQI